jgi:hypothetical protein
MLTNIDLPEVFIQDNAMVTDFENRGGIDLDRNKMNMNISKDAAMGGVNVKFDKAMIERIQRDGFDGLNFKVNSILPTSMPILLGLQPRKEDEERLALVS